MYRLLLTFLLIAVSFISNAQELKKRSRTVDRLTAKYSVLKSDKNVKEGLYELYSSNSGVLRQRGLFKNGEKVGNWQFFDYRGELLHRYNYQTGQLVIVKEETDKSSSFQAQIIANGIVKKEEPDQKPIFIGGLPTLYNDLNRQLTYPVLAKRMGISGDVYVEAIVTKNGTLELPKVVKGIGGGCDEEVIRILKLASDGWIPAFKDGEPIDVLLKLKTTFRLK